jgi:hypothetical protein
MVNTRVVGWLTLIAFHSPLSVHLHSFMVSVTEGDFSSPLDPPASAPMDYNPVFSHRNSMPSSLMSATTDTPRLVSAATIDAILTVNIRSRIPIILELSDPNYNDWRMFFDSALSKFGLDVFVSSSTLIIDLDVDWYKIDSCIVNWIYITCSIKVMCIVCTSKRETYAFSLWATIHNLYHDNQM